jgi:ferrous iron transport protein A
MKQYQQQSQQNQASNPRKFESFTFYGETLQASETEDSNTEVQSNSVQTKSFPLAMASAGEKLQIVKIKGGEGTVRRLIGMGFIPGIEIQVISNSGGSAIVAIGDNRIGLGAGMAQKIMCVNSKE